MNVRNARWKAGGNRETLNNAMTRGSYLPCRLVPESKD